MTSDSEDFGYDFSAEEEDLLFQLASVNPAPAPIPVPQSDGDSTVETIDSVPLNTATISEQDDLGVENSKEPAEAIQYPDLSAAVAALENEKASTRVRPLRPHDDDSFESDLSPLQRFRSYPRKPLTVSDLVSGAWCELQYYYTLTRLPYGRRTRTAAMKQGSKLHQKLEDEVHTTVKIDVLTKEDAFGLRLWNFIQGLRTLREKGLTRELEVWGMIDGNLVNGIIDSVSYENPNPEFEEELSSQEQSSSQRQSSLTDYFPPTKPRNTDGTMRKIYLTDVKTRGSVGRVSSSLLRPAKVQLLLYHRFLSDMAEQRLDLLAVLRRYGLDADDPFSDTFIAEMASLHDEMFDEAEPGGRSHGSQDATSSELVKYGTLRELIPLVNSELRLTFPAGEQTLGHMLRVHYVHRTDGRHLDQHDFPVSKQALQGYLSDYMTWWRGERNAKGVEIEEAFKCRTCEFAADCTWRQEKDRESLQNAHQKVRE